MVGRIDSTMKKSGSVDAVKFLCSYGGKILPRHPDGELRYVGGETRVISVDRFISFTDLLAKLRDLYGSSVSLRCQLPKEDLDALVSITSDEDLANLIEEYDRASQAASSPLKIKSFLSPPKKASPSASVTSSINSASSGKYSPPAVGSRVSPLHRIAAVNRCVRQMSTAPVGYTVSSDKSAGERMRHYPNAARGNPTHHHLVHNGFGGG